MENNTIGELLRTARKNQNVTLEEVANKTKININILRSLERDDLESLPNKTYVKGFVKNCAKTLGLEGEVALAALQNGYQALEPEKAPLSVDQERADEAVEKPAKASESNDQEAKERRQIEIVEFQNRVKGIIGQLINKKILAGLAAILVLFFIVKGAISFFSSISAEKDSLTNAENTQDVQADSIKPSDANILEMDNADKIGQSSDTEEASQESKPSAEEPQVAKETEVEATVESVKTEETPKEEVKEEEPEIEENAQKLPPGKLPFVKFYSAPRNLFSLNSEAQELEDEAIFPAKYKAAMNPDKSNLFINAVEGDTWLSYQADGEEVKRFVLKKGRTLFIQAEDVILLFMGNLNATKIFYNNQLVEAQTRTGVKSLIFPEEKATEYDLPLFPSYSGVPYRQDTYKKNMVAEPAE